MKSLICLALIALAPAALAASVYDSPGDDGAPAGVASIATDGTQRVLYLYIDGGPNESAGADKCSGSGDGDELCGWDLRIVAQAGMAIEDFLPEPGVVANLQGALLRANGIDAINPSAGPQRVGALIVSSLGDGDLVLGSGIAVGSTLAPQALGPTTLASTSVQTDTDGDGTPDASDNCTIDANPDQRDSDGDGFGNVCDTDLNNDNITNALDLGIFKSVFFSDDADADFNGDGIVNVVDLGTLKQRFFQPPGPSGVAQ